MVLLEASSGLESAGTKESLTLCSFGLRESERIRRGPPRPWKTLTASKDVLACLGKKLYLKVTCLPFEKVGDYQPSAQRVPKKEFSLSYILPFSREKNEAYC